MLDFSTIPNTTGAFPSVVSNNVSAPGAADGTPVLKNWIDQVFGAFQALLNEAGLTPNAVSESSTNSQIVDAIKAISGTPGQIITWVGQESDPAIVGVRALALQGQGILRANYADLDTAIYCGNSNNATASSCFRADDAAGTSRNTSGVYLILPDMRGRFLRGLDVAGTRDYQPGRIIGNYQNAGVNDHIHTIIDQDGKYAVSDTINLQPGAANVYYFERNQVLGTYYLRATDVLSGGTGSNDNVPYNMAVHFWIRY